MNNRSTLLPEPDTSNNVDEQWAYFTRDPVACALLDALPQGIGIINRSLRLVAANQTFLEFAGAGSAEALIGTHLEEALRCSHYGVEPYGGTGTCLSCGMRMALMAAMEKRRYVGECQIVRGKEVEQGTRELRLTLAPLHTDKGWFTVVSAEDIDAEKRLQSLESIFHHDLRNTAGILHGTIEALHDGNYAGVADQLNLLLRSSSTRLVSEIESQGQLLKAERGLLELDVDIIHSQEVLDEVASLYDAHPDFHGCRVQVAADSSSFEWESDATVLGRILGNMVKNALEACRPGDTVTIGAEESGISCRFWVHNPGVISKSIQGQLFGGSHSTKGSGRGLGTYGMKMLSERYLGGLIGYSSSAEAGTVFDLTLPRTP